MNSAVIWDNHGCMPLREEGTFLEQLARYRSSGVTVASLNIGMAYQSRESHLQILTYMREWITQRPDAYRLVTTVEHIRECKADGKLGIVFDIEGMTPVLDDSSWVQRFYDLGVRWMLIAYNRNNAAGGGCLDTDGGLTALGRTTIDEMQRVGMVLCLSHTGARTAAEAIDYSKQPTIFSHSNPYGHTPHPRNISDEVMRVCARKGGVIGLSGIGPFLGANGDLVPHLLRQLRYVIDLVGPEHVGLGLDYVFDRASLNENIRRNPAQYPAGISGGLAMIEPESLGEIADGLAQDNLSDAQIRGILGENWLRVAARVWKP